MYDGTVNGFGLKTDATDVETVEFGAINDISGLIDCCIFSNTFIFA
jgi:hypothetical protein